MIGTPHIHLETVDSTNRYARDLLREEPEEGTLVTAAKQTAGRGRLDRRWLSGTGENILASIILRPPRAMEDWGGLPLLAGLAVTRAVRRIANIEAHVKWPNDVLVEGRKLCGILVESGGSANRAWAIVGIGVNVNQSVFEGEYRLPPTSLALESGRQQDLSSVLAALCEEIETLYLVWKRDGNTAVLTAWKSASRMIGRRVTVEGPEGSRAGRAIDLAEDAALIVEWDDGTREPVYAGDVTVREELA
ncbi:MAG: biotin--[acetyl-CoA-carboxylase] ligase [Bacteroidetes bacterium]|nr:biotin--[acetyl-CoA-carboxylase] ligase [Bacteroidota bacterium]